MAKYRPDIKPPMWGPPEAVQYAVRVNAERLGIDYSEISVFLATWEGGGNALHGPVGGPYAMGSGCQWSSFGLYTNGSSSGVIDLGNITIGSGVATIIQRVMCDSSNVFSLSSRSGATSAGYEFLLGYGGVAGRARLRWQDSSSHFSTTIGDISGLNDGKYHSLCAQFTQDVGRFYADGTLIVSDSRNGELNNSQNCFIAKRGSTYMQGHPNDTLLIARNSFTEDQIAQLHATPYALLMPVSRPVYFDLGAGGGTALTILQALQANIASTGTTYADLNAGIATPAINSHDLSAVIAISGSCANDLWATIATSGTVNQDAQSTIATDATLHQALQAAIATEIQTSADLLLTVSELVGQVVSQDLRLSIATAQTGLADLQTSIATLGEIRQGLRLAVATALTTLHDISIQIAELIGTIVRQDLQLVIASELQQAQAVALSVASAASTAQTTLAAVATEQTTAAPLTVEVTTLLESLADLELRIESIVTSVVSQNLRLGIATEMAVLQDLRLTVAEITDVLTAVFEVPARFKTFTLPTRNKTFRV